MLQPQGVSRRGTADSLYAIPIPVKLEKKGPDDDPKAFLATCEKVASTAGWATEHWAMLMVPFVRTFFTRLAD